MSYKQCALVCGSEITLRLVHWQWRVTTYCQAVDWSMGEAASGAFTELAKVLDTSQPIRDLPDPPPQASLSQAEASLDELAHTLDTAERELTSASNAASQMHAIASNRAHAEADFLRAEASRKEDQIDQLRDALVHTNESLRHRHDSACAEAGQLRQHAQQCESTLLHAQQHATSVPQEQAPHAPAQSQRSLGSNYHQAVSLIQSALSQLPLLYAGSASHNHPLPPSSHPFSPKKKQQQQEQQQQQQQQQEGRPTQSSICPGQREQLAPGRAAEEAHNSDQAKSLAALSNAYAEVRALRQTIVSRLPDSAQETRRNA